MSLTITTLLPDSVTLGGGSGNIPTPTTTPPLIGDGSLVDDSDATGVELGSSSTITETAFATFTFPASLNPIWCYVAIRARNSAGSAAMVNPTPLLLMQDASTSDGTDLYSNLNGPMALEAGTVSSPDWFEIGSSGLEITDLTEPSYLANWFNIVEDMPELGPALTGPGLRVGWSVMSVQTGRQPFIDLFEVRLVVAYESTGPTRAPWLRQYPRSPLRHWPPERSYQRSNRRAGGYL